MLEVPESPKIYTTVYDNFKGVDFTNDATNVWKRRSPTGKNMLPDSSGRPFKRHGWEILLSNDELKVFLAKYSVATVTETTFNEDKTNYFLQRGNVYDRCTEESEFDATATYYEIDELPSTCYLHKCSYFEIAGVDHIVIFTDSGVIFYNEIDGVTDINKEYDCYSSYERYFFFEGDGTSAFYIYGNFRMWRYGKDFVLEEVTDQLTVPTVLIATSADCVGTVHYGYNLLGNKAAVDYNDDTLFTAFGSGDFVVSVDDSFKSDITLGARDMWEWQASVNALGAVTWTPVDHSVAFSSKIHCIGNVKTGDKVSVVYIYGVVLPNNVSQNQSSEMKVSVSTGTQFDTELEILGMTSTIQDPSTQCKLITSEYENGRAWIRFGKDWYTSDWQGMDYIEVVFPSVMLDITEYSSTGDYSPVELGGQATLIVGGTP